MNFLKQEFPQKVSNSKELWISVVSVFILISISGLDISVLQKIARIQPAPISHLNKSASSETANLDANKELPSLADYSLSMLADSFEDMTLKKAFRKILREKLEIPGSDPSLRELAQENQISINRIIEIVSKGEKLKKGQRLGKPVSQRTINEAIEEIGITKDEALSIFSRKNIMHTGDFDLTLKDISEENKILPFDLYAILSGKEPQSPEDIRQEASNKRPDSDYIIMIQTKTLDELVDIIAKEQPKSNVSKKVIMERLSLNQIKFADGNQTLAQISSQNNLSVDDLMQTIHTGRRPAKPPVKGAKKLDGPPPHINENQNNARRVIQTSIAKIAVEYKLEEAGLLKALRDGGYDAHKHQTVEDIAKAYDQRPGAILKVLKKEKNKQEGKE
ncbi:Uncharacterised protein [Candidatus Venteria ishoeyi]|uniref:Uncharacterized protein n=2 Tax=Candidatus Venteria ishoeyi TaxID=1899563 RepID=A0A1H6FAW0_9GAMM|nr:Uncharacterised protein [Candidatus Venteria ishoeyi]